MVGHKTCHFVFWLTPLFLDRFLHFMYQRKQEWTLQNGYKIYELTLTLPWIVAMVFTVRNDHLQQIPAVRSIKLVLCNEIRRIDGSVHHHHATFTVCHPVFVFSMSVRIFHDESSSWKSFWLLQILVKILSSQLTILLHSISLHYCNW